MKKKWKWKMMVKKKKQKPPLRAVYQLIFARLVDQHVAARQKKVVSADRRSIEEEVETDDTKVCMCCCFLVPTSPMPS